MPKIAPFQVHCSAIGLIMANVPKIDYSDIAELEMSIPKLTEIANEKGNKRAINAVESAVKKLAEMKEKYYNQRTIPEGAQTIVEEHFRNCIYNRKGLPQGSKHTIKGTKIEWEAIGFINEILGTYYAKNEELLFNEWMVGTPDIVEPNLKNCELIVDAKCPFTHSTMPIKNTPLNKLYWWQVQGYMHLSGAKQAKVIYCLMNAPVQVIESECWRIARLNGLSEYTPEIVEMVTRELTYDDIDPALRIKVYDVEYDPDAINQIQQRVFACNEYLRTL